MTAARSISSTRSITSWAHRRELNGRTLSRWPGFSCYARRSGNRACLPTSTKSTHPLCLSWQRQHGGCLLTLSRRLTPAAFDLLTAMFCYDPAKRPSASIVLEHDYFMTEEPIARQAIESVFFPAPLPFVRTHICCHSTAAVQALGLTHDPLKKTRLKDLEGDWHEFESKALRRENERRDKEARRAHENNAHKDQPQQRPSSSSQSHQHHQRDQNPSYHPTKDQNRESKVAQQNQREKRRASVSVAGAATAALSGSGSRSMVGREPKRLKAG